MLSHGISPLARFLNRGILGHLLDFNVYIPHFLTCFDGIVLLHLLVLLPTTWAYSNLELVGIVLLLHQCIKLTKVWVFTEVFKSFSVDHYTYFF